jgi:hypothetical protein
MGTLERIQENAREILEQDSKFLERSLFFFELRLPTRYSVTGSNRFLFPIMLPPNSYTLEEPFSLEVTRTQDAGLYVEENGIIERKIQLRGHTGFRPRSLTVAKGSGVNVAVPIHSVEQSHSRTLPMTVYSQISGQRHFQYLQDSVFRAYGDLKKNPETAKDTALIFHNTHDQEAWWVVPETFTLERDSKSPFLYRYSITLLVVGAGALLNIDFSEDISIFNKLKNFVSNIKEAVQLAQGALNDLNALSNEVGKFVRNLRDIIFQVGDILDGAQKFADGISPMIDIPLASLKATLNLITNAAASIEAYIEHNEGSAKTFPDTVKQKFYAIEGALENLGTNSAVWETPYETTIRKIREQQEGRYRNEVAGWSSSAYALDSAQVQKDMAAKGIALKPVSTLEDVRNLGTAYTPGELTSLQGKSVVGRATPQYRSARSVTVAQGDTLSSLAARYLGDARLWQKIAILNGLKPPFLDYQASAPLVGSVRIASEITGAASGADEAPFINALGLGSEILIPSNMLTPNDFPLLPVLGVQSDESSENQFCGTDLLLKPVQDATASSRVLYDVPIETELGSVDAQTISGVQNVIQMLQTRLTTERGADTLYKQVGIDRVVGLGFSGIDIELFKFRIVEAVMKDPRIAGVRKLEVLEELDQMQVRMEITVRGFAEARVLRVNL